MLKRFLVLGLLLGFAGFAMFGCGSGATSSTPSTTQSVSISGTVAASSSDLSQLGVSSLSVKASSGVDLTDRGFTSASVKAANLVPLATSKTFISVGPMNRYGTVEPQATAEVGSDGSYVCTLESFDTSKTYSGVVTKTDTSRNKTLEYKVVYPSPTNSKISGSDAQVSPQTTLVAQMIIEKVVKVLESASIDPKVIANVKDAIISAVDALISSGAITVTGVRDATATDNQSLLEAADKAASDSTISGKMDAVKGSLGLAKATDFDSARGAMYDLFKVMTGDPKGIPGEIVDAFARAYLNGVTKTTKELTDAMNNSLYNLSTNVSVAGTITAAEVANEIQGMLRYMYSSSGAAQIQAADAPPEGVKTIILAVFPKVEWASKTIDSSTSFNVPQTLLLINVGERIARSKGFGFNPPKAAQALGLMPGVEDKAKIMHAELRIVSFENWEGFTPDPTKPGEQQKPSATRALASWVDVGNVVNPDPTATQGYTCWLTYPDTSGSTTTVSYETVSHQAGASIQSIRSQSEDGKMGPPPGWKNFQIQPWGQGPGKPGRKITDFKAGNATITVKKADGTVVDTKSVVLVDINLSNVDLTVNVPKMGWIDQLSSLTRVSKGAKPTFNWKLTSAGVTIPDGYRLGYVINLIKGQIQSGGGGQYFFNANWGDPNARIYDSWDKQDFPDATVGAAENWAVPVPLSSEAFYEFGITVVALNKKTNQPVSEGPHRGGLLIVGSPEGLSNLKQQYNTVLPPPPGEKLTSQTISLEGKVHTNLLQQRFSGSGVKVGLFREQYDAAKGFALNIVSAVTPVGLTTVTGQTYKTFKLTFSGSVFGTNYGHYALIIWNDTNGNGAFDSGEDFDRSQVSIGHHETGTEVHYLGGGGQLADADKQNIFNFVYSGDSF